MSTAVTTPEPLLRTLAPALRQLQRSLRGWLDGPHGYPLTVITSATLQGLDTDLRRGAEALDIDRPLLVVMLMGGTGVGKSTLLNALAGGSIADASVARPTTRDPVVYYHETIKPDRLDPALQHCRLVSHDRPNLAQKILVDTPDLDSNDLANREKLLQLLPVADVVLYVGSQEKYHDRLGWDLFLHQRRRRAFAFVLNKWDRCVHAGAEGVRPDEDLLQDLRSEGFANPLLFRTCAQFWVDRPGGDGAMHAPEGEQFNELVQWLELGLSRLEIEAIKARGIRQLLWHLQKTLDAACPPDLTEAATATQKAWEHILSAEAAATAEVLLNTLEPYQREIEHHFAREGQRRFRGLMATYLNVFTRARYVGSTLRDRIPLMPRSTDTHIETPASWDLATFTRTCSRAAGEQHLDARGRALVNRLLVAADQQHFPLDLLTTPTEAVSKLDWRQRHGQALIEVIEQVERRWTNPRGGRRWLQTAIIWAGNTLPLAALFGICALLLWQYTVPNPPRQPALGDFLLPVIVVFIVLVLLHILITVLLPMRWAKMRGEIQQELSERLQRDLNAAYTSVPAHVAEELLQERRQIDRLQSETRAVAAWLDQREQAATIAGLYGSEK
jgi:energy-coupling factor transporter ATP-binding protein EcfA2